VSGSSDLLGAFEAPIATDRAPGSPESERPVLCCGSGPDLRGLPKRVETSSRDTGCQRRRAGFRPPTDERGVRRQPVCNCDARARFERKWRRWCPYEEGRRVSHIATFSSNYLESRWNLLSDRPPGLYWLSLLRGMGIVRTHTHRGIGEDPAWADI